MVAISVGVGLIGVVSCQCLLACLPLKMTSNWVSGGTVMSRVNKESLCCQAVSASESIPSLLQTRLSGVSSF
ncbi:hypothetical protein CC86DRAFT_3522 [Ophiobolus disseminans]|uniref:Secreted protein n=1 Tax=Ophiobolus disseminans TaxID=1469910 RepID=A0A6A7AIR9_9PLEO|nr:hypothetical protein CC86DRAFT_3522 [Ophiobolus disseminans]